MAVQARWLTDPKVASSPFAGHARTHLAIAYKQRPWLQVAGLVTYVANSKYSANLHISEVTREPVQVSCEYHQLQCQPVNRCT